MMDQTQNSFGEGVDNKHGGYDDALHQVLTGGKGNL